MSGYVLHLPQDDSVVLSGAVARRLMETGNGDAALLYIAVVRNRGSMEDERLRGELKWSREKFSAALEALKQQGLVALPGEEPRPEPPRDLPRQERGEYTRADIARALEGGEFSSLTGAVEEKLGKKLTTPELQILLGLYSDLGLPADVIFLLVGFCVEKITAQYGAGRRPTLRQIEKEGYLWARLGLMDQAAAAAYIRRIHSSRQALPGMMRLLRLGERAPSPSEEKYLLSWAEMGFDEEALEQAYDRTILKCKELKWPYMNKILLSWHQKGLHTLEEIRRGDVPAVNRELPDRSRSSVDAARENLARMEKYKREMEKKREGGRE